MPKGRQALLDLGTQAPDLVDTGTVDWDESLYGPANGRQKPPISFAEQACCRELLILANGGLVHSQAGGASLGADPSDQISTRATDEVRGLDLCICASEPPVTSTDARTQTAAHGLL